jgi:[acyl-carrier-protein] S-malonyltransferase
MGADLFEARPDLLGPDTDRVLGWSLRRMCLDGPEEALTRTEHAQPALFALSVALWEEVRRETGWLPSAGAGHSLGEYSVLVAAGTMDYDDALKVVAERGQAMADAADEEPSGMAALLGVDPPTARKVVLRRRSEGGRLFVANDNAPGQLVVAGGKEDLEWLGRHARELGIKRVVPLKVAGAFHSAFVRSASKRVSAALERVDLTAPSFPVYSNVTAEPHRDHELRGLLAEQVIARVRFRETLLNMASTGIDTFIHLGPGDVTAGMARRTVDGSSALAISDLQSIRPAFDSLSALAASSGGS